MLEKLLKNMKVYDISLIKLSVFFFTLLLLTGWPAFAAFFLGVDWYWYLILFVIVTIPLLKKMF